MTDYFKKKEVLTMVLRNNVTPINNFDFNGSNVFTIEINGKIWFYGNQIAILLGYKHPGNALNELVRKNHTKTLKQSAFPDSGQSIGLWNGNDHSVKKMIDVSGVYALVLRSTLPQAEEFQDWVTDEVLPSIHQTGGYQVNANLSELDKLVAASSNMLKLTQSQSKALNDHDARIGNLENTMTIDSHEAKKIHDLGQSLALKAIGGKKSQAYKKIGHKVYRRLWITFDNHFDITTYKDLEKVKKEEALNWLSNSWHLDMDLQDEVDALNNQGTLF